MKPDSGVSEPKAHAATSEQMEILISKPSASDGYAVSQLVSRCPPLDGNSTYCNILQCDHFSDTCAIAKSEGNVLGFVSGFIHPQKPDVLFVWQIAVDERARGQRLAPRMLKHLLERETCSNVQYLETTISPGNAASEAVFKRLAKNLGTEITHVPYYTRDIHFDGKHDDEVLFRVGPFSART